VLRTRHFALRRAPGLPFLAELAARLWCVRQELMRGMINTMRNDSAVSGVMLEDSAHDDESACYFMGHGTSSFERSARIWDATTGQGVDGLPRPYR
jgi:hypothetical protein